MLNLRPPATISTVEHVTIYLLCQGQSRRSYHRVGQRVGARRGNSGRGAIISHGLRPIRRAPFRCAILLLVNRSYVVPIVHHVGESFPCVRACLHDWWAQRFSERQYGVRDSAIRIRTYVASRHQISDVSSDYRDLHLTQTCTLCTFLLGQMFQSSTRIS